MAGGGQGGVGRARVGQAGQIGGGEGAAAVVPGVEMAQLDAEEGGLEGVEPAVVARDLVDVFAVGAVVAQPAQARRAKCRASRPLATPMPWAAPQ